MGRAEDLETEDENARTAIGAAALKLVDAVLLADTARKSVLDTMDLAAMLNRYRECAWVSR